MDTSAVALFSTHVTSPVCYALVALGLAVVIRLVLGVLKAFEIAASHNDVTFGTALGRMLIGLSAKSSAAAEGKGDYLAPLALGWLELLTIPVLMRASLWLYIGAWVGLKALAQYKHWTDNRSMFNRFLIGNVLVLVFAFLILSKWVVLSPR